MKEDTWKALEKMFCEHPILKAGPVPAEELCAAEAELGIPLTEDYREFVLRYGGAMVGAYPVFGLRRALPMGKDDGSFVNVTRPYRRQRWPGVDMWAVISTDHAGNPIGLDEHGKIWVCDHDARAVQEI